jgi:glucan 1,3-beta-glucosidase
MHRRSFLKNTLGSALTLAALKMPGLTFAGDATPAPTTPNSNLTGASSLAGIRGVNLGGWLVLEKWMVPDVFDGTKAPDEYSLSLGMGDKAKGHLDRHHETFITDADFRWIRDCGLNAVRLPVGYWALEGPQPYVESGRFIDFALDQAQQNGLKLLLDLHGAPGSQNGWDHSGRSGPINWPHDPHNVNETLRILRPRLNPSVAIVFHDSFRPLAWKKFMQEPAFNNVILDTHLYQCFSEADKSRTLIEHLAFALNRKKTLDEMQSEELPTIVGEWSLSLPANALDGLSRLQVESAIRCYADAQLLNFEGTHGWFFWSYKLRQKSEWNFRHCVEQGRLPATFVA